MVQCKQCKNLQSGMNKRFNIIEEAIEKENKELELFMSWKRR